MKSKKAPTADLDTIVPLLINIWRRFHKEAGPPDKLQTREFRRVIECLKMLEAQHDGKQSLLGVDYFQNRELLASYLLYPWIIHYQEALSLIGELPKTPKRVLDVCSGPAPFAFAALRHGATEVYATDRNVAALELGAQICGRYGMPMTVRRWDCSKDAVPIEGQFDLITLGHALSELFPATVKGWQIKEQQFIQYLLGKLKPTGFLLLAESSQPEPNRRLLTLRDALVAQGITVQAPCIWQSECPALKTPNSPCYAQREMAKPYLVKEVQRAMGIKLSSLKMTYLLLRSPQAAPLPETTLPLYRVISPPIESYQGKRFYLCGTDGKKSLGSRLAESTASVRAFDYLRRGDLIEVENALQQGLALDLIEGSSITVKAPCGKPAPQQHEKDEWE